MTNRTFAVGESICFAEEPGHPYIVRAIDERFAILTRPMTAEDAEEGERYGDLDGEVVYTIVDSETLTRGPNNLVLNCYEYKTLDGCRECLSDLRTGNVEMSRRYSVPLVLCDHCVAKVRLKDGSDGAT